MSTPKCEACRYPSHSCMGMLMEGIGNRCLAVRVELPMFPRPGPKAPARRCEHAASGCGYPEGECAGLCLAQRPA
ncbi:hypothetical protein [Hydrogenophaga laconesensis]|uniref:Uncharacterized protein n=1 Tax=Hydrogenophaga laconesensis TaxID=1805971 RepID=A0ABU1VDJ9_9BURK|nr:hypothetical protein [Hydrogenophaga laconesensis]MDR7095544.1 hypothetical protein [Hydrogenophaga laconesensis]